MEEFPASLTFPRFIVPGLATVATAATVVTAPTDIAGGLQFAVALQVPILTMIDVSAAWLHFKNLDVPTIILLLPMSFVGMFLGMWLSEKLSDAHARLLTGIFLLIILAVQLGKDAIMDALSKSSRTPKDQSYAKIVPADPDANQYHLDDDLAMAETGDNNPLRKRTPSSSSESSIQSETKNGLSSQANAAAPTAVDKSSSVSLSSKRTKTNDPQQITNSKTKLIWACVVGIIGGTLS